ncbi:MAG: cupin [Nitrospirae bacterium]|nr:cupin [Nitrospirota bacterium]
MATLRIPDTNVTIPDPSAVRQFLGARGIVYERWSADRDLLSGATNEHVLDAYSYLLKPLMGKGGYRTADVISVDRDTPNLAEIREKFRREHTHSEDEVRVFVEGQGFFWFHKEGRDDEVFALLCEQGDLISVPANTKHWFDLGDPPKVRAIRIFTDQAGWVPHYTNSGIDQRYRW